MKSRRVFALVAWTVLVVPTVLATPGVIIRAAQPVHGEYIVLFNMSVPESIGRPALSSRNATVLQRYPDINGYYVRMSDAEALALTHDPNVRSVEENAIMMLAGTQSGLDTPLSSGSGGVVNASQWGLDRIDQTSPAAPRLDDTYTWCATGAGIRVYIVDTGVLTAHPEFSGRTDDAAGTALADYLTLHSMGLGSQCWSTQNNDYSPAASHGTSVASIVAGTQFGVAKGATIVDARALNCGGGMNDLNTSARMTAVIDWICRLDNARQSGRSVINISSSAYYTQGNPDQAALSQQISTASSTYNIPVVVAAGNYNDNTFWYLPANATGVIAAGGLNRDTDSRWCCYTQCFQGTCQNVGSNWGPNVIVYAPAQRVESASTTSTVTVGLNRYRSELPGCETYADTCTSGTSFAAPHVAGVVARYLERHPGATTNTIIGMLQSMSATYSGARVTEPGGVTEPVLVFNECP